MSTCCKTKICPKYFGDYIAQTVVLVVPVLKVYCYEINLLFLLKLFDCRNAVRSGFARLRIWISVLSDLVLW